MMLHPRETVVRNAQADLLGVYGEWLSRHNDLTELEIMNILLKLMHNPLKYALRYERHGDYETPSGLSAVEESEAH